MMKRTEGLTLALAMPLLMAPMPSTCRVAVSSHVELSEPAKDEYCREDVPVQAQVTMLPNSQLRPAALLAVLRVRDLSLTVLKREDLRPGAAQALSDTIPWSTLASDRGGMYIVIADVGASDAGTVRPGAELDVRRYDAAYGEISTLNLYARATRTFKVCD